MEQILGLFISFLMSLNSGGDCEIQAYTYNIPEGINVIHDNWERGRSNLVISDEFGNSFDIYKTEKYLLEDRIKAERERWGKDLLDEERVSDDIYKFYVYNPGPADAFDSMYLVEKDTFMVGVYGYFQGDSSTHDVFEEKALQLVRSIARGGLQDGTHCGDGFDNNRWTWRAVWESIR